MSNIIKYPRTVHIQGSRKSGDDFELEDASFEVLRNNFVVYEFKIDGSNCGISFEDGEMILQSRGHQLRGGAREKEFVMFKMWATSLKSDLQDVLGERYIMYGENTYAKHSIFYDKLPHYFLEFDVYDKEKNIFLSTSKRQKLLEGLDYVPVPIAYSGKPIDLNHLKSFIGKSIYQTTDWKANLKKQAEYSGLNIDLVCSQTDMSGLEEGIYIKVENEDETIGRYKFVREDFVLHILKKDDHWHDRPILKNMIL